MKRHNRLEEFVRLLWAHYEQVKKSMQAEHPINKYKNAKKRGLLISTGELCEIFVVSKLPLAQRYCFSFGMQDGSDEQFQAMIDRLRRKGYANIASELIKRSNKPYIDIQFSANLLTPQLDRKASNYRSYKDHSFFVPRYQFLKGRAEGYQVDWALVEEAVARLDYWRAVADKRAGSSAVMLEAMDRRSVPKLHVSDQKPPSSVEKNTPVHLDIGSNLLEAVRESIERTQEFDPSSDQDAREKTLRAIVVRQGQAQFRSGLMEAYHGTCAITRCNVPDALEAAHILPYKGSQWNSLSNGLLLRADIHVLFDLGLLTIDPDSLTVQLSDHLKGSSYAELQGKFIATPEAPDIAPNKQALAQHKAQSHT